MAALASGPAGGAGGTLGGAAGEGGQGPGAAGAAPRARCRARRHDLTQRPEPLFWPLLPDRRTPRSLASRQAGDPCGPRPHLPPCASGSCSQPVRGSRIRQMGQYYAMQLLMGEKIEYIQGYIAMERWSSKMVRARIALREDPRVPRRPALSMAVSPGSGYLRERCSSLRSSLCSQRFCPCGRRQRCSVKSDICFAKSGRQRLHVIRW